MASFLRGFATGFLRSANQQFDEARYLQAEKDKFYREQFGRTLEGYKKRQAEIAKLQTERDAKLKTYTALLDDPELAAFAVDSELSLEDATKLRKNQRGTPYKSQDPFADEMDMMRRQARESAAQAGFDPRETGIPAPRWIDPDTQQPFSPEAIRPADGVTTEQIQEPGPRFEFMPEDEGTNMQELLFSEAVKAGDKAFVGGQAGMVKAAELWEAGNKAAAIALTKPVPKEDNKDTTNDLVLKQLIQAADNPKLWKDHSAGVAALQAGDIQGAIAQMQPEAKDDAEAGALAAAQANSIAGSVANMYGGFVDIDGKMVLPQLGPEVPERIGDITALAQTIFQDSIAAKAPLSQGHAAVKAKQLVENGYTIEDYLNEGATGPERYTSFLGKQEEIQTTASELDEATRAELSKYSETSSSFKKIISRVLKAKNPFTALNNLARDTKFRETITDFKTAAAIQELASRGSTDPELNAVFSEIQESDDPLSIIERRILNNPELRAKVEQLLNG